MVLIFQLDRMTIKSKESLKLIRSENLLFIIPMTLRKLLPPMIYAATVSQISNALIVFILISIYCGTDGLAILALFLPLNYLWDGIDDVFNQGGTTLFALTMLRPRPAPDRDQCPAFILLPDHRTDQKCSAPFYDTLRHFPSVLWPPSAAIAVPDDLLALLCPCRTHHAWLHCHRYPAGKTKTACAFLLAAE